MAPGLCAPPGVFREETGHRRAPVPPTKKWSEHRDRRQSAARGTVQGVASAWPPVRIVLLCQMHSTSPGDIFRAKGKQTVALPCRTETCPGWEFDVVPVPEGTCVAQLTNPQI